MTRLYKPCHHDIFKNPLCLNVIFQTVLLIIVMLFIHLFYLLLSCYLSISFTYYCHVIYPSVLLIIVMLFFHLFYFLLSCYLSIWFTYCCHVIYPSGLLIVVMLFSRLPCQAGRKVSTLPCVTTTKLLPHAHLLSHQPITVSYYTVIYILYEPNC